MLDAALEGIPQRRPFRAAQGSSTPCRGNQGRNGRGRGRHLHPSRGGPIKTREHAAVISIAGQMRRLRGLRGHAVPNFGISFHLRAHGCAEVGMGVWVWFYGSGWRGPGGYYRCAARPPLFIQCFFGLSLLFACPFSPPAAVLFLLFYHSFVHFLNQACWRQSEEAEAASVFLPFLPIC